MHEEMFDSSNSILGVESSQPPFMDHYGGFDENGHNNNGISMEKQEDDAVISIELEHQLKLDMEHNALLQQQMIHDQMEMSFADQSHWEHRNNMMNNTHHHPTANLLHHFQTPDFSASPLLPTNASMLESDPTTDHDFQTQQISLNYQHALNFLNNASSSGASSVMYDPMFQLNLPPQTPVFRDLFQSMPPLGYGNVMEGGYIFGGGEGESSVGIIYEDEEKGVFEFGATEKTAYRGMGRNIKNAKPTERDRRDHFNNKFQALRSLLPNPTKKDRASIVGDAIDHINELMRTVNELKILVERKRCSKEGRKRQKTAENGEENANYNGSMRSSWLQRKSKDTEVDVRIIDDDVTIKLVQRKKNNCLLLVSKFLDDLNLDLQHVAGGHIGDFYSFLFSSKIYEGSSVYASAIANKLIDVVDRQYATLPPGSTTSSF